MRNFRELAENIEAVLIRAETTVPNYNRIAVICQMIRYGSFFNYGSSTMVSE